MNCNKFVKHFGHTEDKITNKFIPYFLKFHLRVRVRPCKNEYEKLLVIYLCYKKSIKVERKILMDEQQIINKTKT